MESTLLHSQSPDESAEVQQLKSQLAKLHLDDNNKSDNASYYSPLQQDSPSMGPISHQSTEQEAEKIQKITSAIDLARPAQQSPESKDSHFCSGERCLDYKCSSFYLDENDDDDEKIFSQVFPTKASPDSDDQDNPFTALLTFPSDDEITHLLQGDTMTAQSVDVLSNQMNDLALEAQSQILYPIGPRPSRSNSISMDDDSPTSSNSSSTSSIESVSEHFKKLKAALAVRLVENHQTRAARYFGTIMQRWQKRQTCSKLTANRYLTRTTLRTAQKRAAKTLDYLHNRMPQDDGPNQVLFTKTTASSNLSNGRPVGIGLSVQPAFRRLTSASGRFRGSPKRLNNYYL